MCCVVVCDLETSRMGAPYIYIYDISHLRVKVDYNEGLRFGVGNCVEEQDNNNNNSI